MNYTREELIEKIKKNDTDFFEQFYHRDVDCKNVYKIVWELNLGDGNDLYVAIEFPNENLTILLDGTYSSHDSNRLKIRQKIYWDKVSLAAPYQFTETRYKATTISDIRDKKIDDVLND